MRRVFTLGMLSLPAALPLIANASETMTDRCSGEVAIVPHYNDAPNTPGVVVLSRDPNGSTPWTPDFWVETGNSGHIRWWCHSTSGNFLDPGTWRIDELYVGTKCTEGPNGEPWGACSLDAAVSFGSSAWQGWTPERSRCDDRSKHIRAHLGPDRLLGIECLPGS